VFSDEANSGLIIMSTGHWCTLDRWHRQWLIILGVRIDLHISSTQ